MNGCGSAAPITRVEIDALTRGPRRPTAAAIVPGNRDTDINDLHFVEFRGYLAAALAAGGFNVVADASDLRDGDVVVLLQYGMGSPIEVRQLRTTRWLEFAGTGNYTIENSGRTTTVREHRVPGVRNAVYEQRHTEYPRTAFVAAYDVESVRRGDPVVQWEVTLSSQGLSDDFREILPRMLFIAQAYLGQSSGDRIMSEVSQDTDGYSEFIDVGRTWAVRLAAFSPRAATTAAVGRAAEEARESAAGGHGGPRQAAAAEHVSHGAAGGSAPAEMNQPGDETQQAAPPPDPSAGDSLLHWTDGAEP